MSRHPASGSRRDAAPKLPTGGWAAVPDSTTGGDPRPQAPHEPATAVRLEVLSTSRSLRPMPVWPARPPSRDSHGSARVRRYPGRDLLSCHNDVQVNGPRSGRQDRSVEHRGPVTAADEPHAAVAV